MNNDTTPNTAVPPENVTHQSQAEPVPGQSDNPDSLKVLLKQLNAVNRIKDPGTLLDLRTRARQAIPDCESKREMLNQKAAEADDVLEKLALQQESGEIADAISKLQDRLTAITERAKELTSM